MIPVAGSWGPAGFWEEKALRFIAQDEADSHRIGKAIFAKAAGSAFRIRSPRRPVARTGERQVLGECMRLPNVRFGVASGRLSVPLERHLQCQDVGFSAASGKVLKVGRGKAGKACRKRLKS